MDVLAFLPADIRAEIYTASQVKDVPRDTVILREGQYVKVVPVVIEGLLKVLSRFEDKDLLLYYIRPNESCVMSFSAGIKNETSKVVAATEEDSKLLLLPCDKLSGWFDRFPGFGNLFIQQYNLRYNDLIDTISHVLFRKMDQRLLNDLIEKQKLTSQNPLKLSHRQIANELGTARKWSRACSRNWNPKEKWLSIPTALK